MRLTALVAPVGTPRETMESGKSEEWSQQHYTGALRDREERSRIKETERGEQISNRR